jgi:threonylcarbamoyladenosine tRNA methylthiotransferase MtaB
MKVAFHTLGCKVNQYETEALKEKFALKGYFIVDEKDFADIYIINTCTVTNLADRKSRQYIRKMKKMNPSSIVAVTGCYAQINPDEVGAIEGVNLVAGTNEKGRLVDYLEEYILMESQNTDFHIKEYADLTEYEETGIITSMDSKTRALIKIQEGCNRFCSYCIIPYARGPVRSRGICEIVEEANVLVRKGFKEIVLTGINTALYGLEQGKENPGVEQIIKELNDINGDFRIRLSSLEPTVVNKEYVQRLLKYDKLCHHLHLSIQSGSNEILKAMNRKYTREDYLEIVDLLKSFDKNYGITTDIIVGFPGETEENFSDSLKLVRETGFCKVHVFKYSKREGTAAAEMKSHISPEIKNRRAAELMAASENTATGFYKGCIGESRLVLIENIEKGMLTGYTDNYVKTYINSNNKELINKMIKVKIVEQYNDGVKGE